MVERARLLENVTAKVLMAVSVELRQRPLALLRLALLAVGLLLCACSRTPSSSSDKGDEATWISTDETRRVGMHVLLNRYPQAQIVSELKEGRTWRYRFSTNGITLPVVVVVDRKAAKARFEVLRR